MQSRRDRLGMFGAAKTADAELFNAQQLNFED